MPQEPKVPPPFDQGVFLLHYNRGREAFHEARFAEARRELEQAQRMRPDDSEVLNLLGLVYFKTNALPEAEVIYRRLARENPGVFILHSNLGLILFKQSKLDEAEKYLLRAVELRPNYSKSHLYLGLLYKQRKKYGLALEHLQFAGAEKAAREVEIEMKAQLRASLASSAPQRPAGEQQTRRPAAPQTHDADDVDRRTIPGRPSRLPAAETHEVPAPAGGQHAARKLQEAVDETPDSDGRRIDLARKIEGASRTFALHENGFLEINFRRSVYVKRGTVSSYSGNLRFSGETGLVGTTAATLVKVDGEGRIFLYDKGSQTFLLDLDNEFIYVEGANLLALEESLSYRVEPIYDSTYQRKIDTLKIFGRGSLALATSIEPLTLRVTRDYPLSLSSSALVAWTGNLIPTVIDDSSLENVMIGSNEQGFKIRFEGDGVVVSEQ
jgi:uncharacterized protein (AIM24 family)